MKNKNSRIPRASRQQRISIPALKLSPEFLEVQERMALVSKSLQARLSAYVPSSELEQEIARIREGINESLAPLLAIANEVKHVFDSLGAGIHAILQDESLLERFREFPAKSREAVLALAERGWYLSLEAPIGWEITLHASLKRGDFEGVDSQLENTYEENLDDIERNLTEWYPSRAKIIKSAFAAHRRGEYELSVPVLIAQADGICAKELLIQANGIDGKRHLSFFSKNRATGQLQTAVVIDGIAPDSFIAAVMAPLIEASSIHGMVHEETDSPDLRRHGIIHGHMTHYGTKRNSLKMISLVNYIAELFKR